MRTRAGAERSSAALHGRERKKSVASAKRRSPGARRQDFMNLITARNQVNRIAWPLDQKVNGIPRLSARYPKVNEENLLKDTIQNLKSENVFCQIPEKVCCEEVLSSNP